MLQTVSSTVELKLPADSQIQMLAGFQDLVDRFLAERPEELLIDCSDLRRVTSSHIGALWLAHNKCRDTSTVLRIVSPTHNLVSSLKTLDLYDEILINSPVGAGVSRELPERKVPAESEVFTLRFRATVDGINEALTEFKGFVERLVPARSHAAALETVFYEIATNIREHAKPVISDNIDFSATADSSGITLKFIDYGKQFDLTRQKSSFNPDEAIRKGKTRGFGISMVRKLTDSITYVREKDESNVLTLKKYWRNK